MIIFYLLIFSVQSDDNLENEITALRSEKETEISKLYGAFQQKYRGRPKLSKSTQLFEKMVRN
jgi:hypothetical protein